VLALSSSFIVTSPSTSNSAISTARLLLSSESRFQIRRQHAQANSRSFRSLIFPRKKLSIGFGLSHTSHSCSFIAIASLSLAPTDFAAGNRTPACPVRSRQRQWTAMTRRRVLCGLLLASAVLACFAAWLVIVSGPRVTRERFERVKEGMSREEVIR